MKIHHRNVAPSTVHSTAPAKRPRHPGFSAIQGHGRALQSVGKTGGGRFGGRGTARTSWIGALVVILSMTAACSGGGRGSDLVGPIDPGAPAPPTPTDPAPPAVPGPSVLSFAVIAGKWSGAVIEKQACCGEFTYRVTVTLEDGAPRGQRVGGVVYSEGLDCAGDWMAKSASGSHYEVTEWITSGSGCVSPVDIRLTHDPVTQRLGYAFGIPSIQGGAAILEREQ